MPATTHSSHGNVQDAVSVVRYAPTEIVFEPEPASSGTFRHQYDRDLQLLCVWGDAREHDAAVRAYAESAFTVIAEYEVTWSPEHVVTSFERLYGEHLDGTSGKHRAVGAGPFLLLVLEDRDARYAYRRNVSGSVELTNVAMSTLKARARGLVGGYRVHSSNSLQEFFRDATLILGPDRVDDLLAGRAPVTREPVGDPVGTGGWHDLHEALHTLRRAVPYLVLRGFDELPELPSDHEIDVLAQDHMDLGAVLGARPDRPGGAALHVDVAGTPVTFDVRVVGDGYLDALWQSQMLSRLVWRAHDVPTPRDDDYFFSLLYHAKVQKPAVKPEYVPRLALLAKELDLPEDVRSTLLEDDTAAEVLDGYLSAHGYGVPLPRDAGVHRNESVVTAMWRSSVEVPVTLAARRELVARAKSSRAGRLAARSAFLRRCFHGTVNGARRIRGGLR